MKWPKKISLSISNLRSLKYLHSWSTKIPRATGTDIYPGPESFLWVRTISRAVAEDMFPETNRASLMPALPDRISNGDNDWLVHPIPHWFGNMELNCLSGRADDEIFDVDVLQSQQNAQTLY